MRLQVHCPGCNHDGWVDEELAGRTVLCECGAQIVVPAPKLRCPQEPGTSVAPAFAKALPPASPGTPGALKLKLALGVASALLIALLIVGVVILLQRGATSTAKSQGLAAAPSPPPPPAPVSPDQEAPAPQAVIEKVTTEKAPPERSKDEPRQPAGAKPKPAPAPVELGKWEGFRGLKWGTDIAVAPGMTLVETDGDAKIYQRKKEKLSLGEAKLSGIAYAFYKRRFFTVNVETKGASNWEQLKLAVFTTYGEGEKPKEAVDSWVWREEGACLQLEYDQSSEQARLTLSSVRIQDEQLADEAKKAKEAKKDF